MMHKELVIQKLQLLNLSDFEARIYVHLLEKGALTPLQLSRTLKIDRTKVYRSLESLQGKKLIEDISTARGKQVKAAAPENLELLLADEEMLLRQKRNTFPEILADLSSISTHDKSPFEVKHYSGVDGMKQMFWNTLSAKKDILVFGYETKNEIVGKDFAEKVRLEQVRRKIKLYEIENATDQGDYWYTDVPSWGNYYDSRHIPESMMKIKQMIMIFNDTVALMHWWKEEYVGLEVINDFYAEMQKQIFWTYWKILEQKK